MVAQPLVAHDRIEREIVIAAPVEVVWAVITEPAHINGWFGDVSEIDLRPGGRVMFGWTEHDHASYGRVERVEPPHAFAFRWNRGAEEVRDDDSTLVEFTLRPEGESTRVTVVESGFRDVAWPEDEREREAEGHTEGWERELGELAEYAGRL
jgi:uncharacterized protein YndB with AHSA1/START domain